MKENKGDFKPEKNIFDVAAESTHTYLTKQEAVDHMKSLEMLAYNVTICLKQIISEAQYTDEKGRVDDLKMIDKNLSQLEKVMNTNYIIL